MKTGEWIQGEERSVCADTYAEALKLWQEESWECDAIKYVHAWIGVEGIITQEQIYFSGDELPEDAFVGQSWYHRLREDKEATTAASELPEGHYRFWNSGPWRPFGQVSPPWMHGSWRVEVDKRIVGDFDTFIEAKQARDTEVERLVNEWKAEMDQRISNVEEVS